MKRIRSKFVAVPLAVLALALILSGCNGSKNTGSNVPVNNVVDDTPEIDPHEGEILPEENMIVEEGYEEGDLANDMVELCTLHSGKDLRGKDLSGRSLVGGDYQCADFRGANLTGTDFTDANLQGADFRGANLNRGYGAEVMFVGANLSYINAEGVDLSRAMFVDLGGDKVANLSYANLKRSDLTSGLLYGLDLSNADLSYAHLHNTNFAVYSTSGSERRTDLTNAKFVGADATNGYFAGVLANGADFSNSTLVRANFVRADLAEANLDGANTEGAKWDDTTCPDGSSSSSSSNFGSCAA